MKLRFLVAALIAFALPAQAGLPIQQVETPGGLKAWLIEDSDIPFTALEIRFKGGTSLDPMEQRGVVNLMTAQDRSTVRPSLRRATRWPRSFVLTLHKIRFPFRQSSCPRTAIRPWHCCARRW